MSKVSVMLLGIVPLLIFPQFEMLLINGTSHTKMSFSISEQQRCRSACASAQSDQHLCCSLLG